MIVVSNISSICGIRAARRRYSALNWHPLDARSQRLVLSKCIPNLSSLDFEELSRYGFWQGAEGEKLYVLTGNAGNRRFNGDILCQVIARPLPAGSILQVNKNLYCTSPALTALLYARSTVSKRRSCCLWNSWVHTRYPTMRPFISNKERRGPTLSPKLRPRTTKLQTSVFPMKKSLQMKRTKRPAMRKRRLRRRSLNRSTTSANRQQRFMIYERLRAGQPARRTEHFDRPSTLLLQVLDRLQSQCNTACLACLSGAEALIAYRFLAGSSSTTRLFSTRIWPT